MHSLHRRHLSIAFLLLFTLAVNAVVAGFNIARLVGNERAVARTYAILAQTENIVSFGKDAENGAHGFVSSGNPRSLAAFERAQDKLNAALTLLEQNVSDDEEKLELPSLRLRVMRHLEVSRRALDLRRSQGTSAAQKFVAQNRGKVAQDEARELVGKIQTREQDLLQERAAESADSAQNATRTFWIATGANLLFVALVLGLLWRASQQNAQLEGAFSDLKRAESMRDGLSAMLVHDLRTPLTTLLGPLQMLHSGAFGDLPGEQREMVSMSHDSGERLLGLVNELLDISKMEAGEMTIEREIVQNEPLFRAAMRESAADSHVENGKGPRLSCEIAPDLLSVHGERDLLLRVLINLLGNAR